MIELAAMFLVFGVQPAAACAPGVPTFQEAPVVSPGASPAARQYMQSTLDEVSKILLDAALEKKDKRARVQSLIESAVDFATVSKLVLATNWKKLDQGQQEEFIVLFRKHLLYTYWKNAEYATFRGIEITGDRKEQRRDWSVMTKVKNSGSDDILIDYRLRQAGQDGDVGGEWRVIDILIEGVSLVSNFRSQFQSIVANEGPAKLIALLRDKVAEAERAQSQ